jgi:hypothetical protein
MLCAGTRQCSWLRPYATSWKVAGSILDEVIVFFNLPKPSSHTTALELTQPLTEMSTRNPSGGKYKLERKDDNLTDICEPTVLQMWKPRCLTTLRASKVCYRDNIYYIMCEDVG